MQKTYFSKTSHRNRAILVLTTLFFSAYLLAQNITKGLILHYNFDQLKPSFTTLVDLSGSGYNANIYGNFAVADGESGKPTDKAIQLLDRDRHLEKESGYLHLPDNVTDKLTDFTFAVWVKLDKSSTWSRIFDFGSGTDTNMFLTPRSGSGTVRFAIKLDNNVGEQVVDGKIELPTDEWTHVVVTGDYNTNTLKIYVNGLLNGTAIGVTTTPASLGETLEQNYIGKSQYTSDPSLLGCIDDFRIYNRALSQHDIYVLYGFSEEEIENMPRNGDGELFNYLNSFTLDNKEIAQSINDQLYYYSLPLSEIDNDVNLLISFEKTNANHIVKIDGQEVSSDLTYTFKNIDAPEQRHKIEIVDTDDNVLATEYLVFTGLPIVQVYTNGYALSKNFTPGMIRVHDSTSDKPYQLFNTEMRYRGNITLNYQKKSFSIKLLDDDFVKKNYSYYGLRDDNYWILDAMPIDKSRMRNRVATDLWNDFSADLYYKNEKPDLINGTRGQYVEVFLDDQYWGLYCMTERIDRKQLQLKKYDESKQKIHGILYKAKEWSYAVMMGYVPDRGVDPYYEIADFNNYAEYWENYKMNYPDLEDGHLIDWEPLYDLVFFVSKSDDWEFMENIEKYIDLPVWRDYYLMMEYILAVDNHGKNCYVSIRDITKNPMFTITPWDMDATLGRRWNASAVGAEQNYPEYTVRHEHGEHYLFRRLLDTNALNFNDLLKQRYDELRFSYFVPENMMQRFQQYKEIFERSGAAEREVNRWSGTNGIVVNFDSELQYLENWLTDRYNFLNEQYGDPIILPDPNGLTDNNAHNKIISYPNPVTDMLYIRNIKSGDDIQILSMQGTKVYSQMSSGSSISIDLTSLLPGAYLLKVGSNAGKLIMKQ